MKLECSYVQLPKIYSHLNGNEFKLFTVIYDEWTMMKNEDGWFYRSQKLLSEDSGLPLRTLQRTLKKLIEKGVILTTFYNDGVKMATYNKANEYKINLEVVYKLCKKDVKMTTEGCQNGAPSKDIKTKKNNNITTGILEHKDLGPTVTEDKENKKEKVNEMKTSTSEDQNKNEVKVNSPKVRPSSTETSNKATGDVQTTKVEQLPTNDIKTQPDAKEMSQEEREEKIASIMKIIELDKDFMFKAENYQVFDTYFQDFNLKLANLKHLVSEEAYKNYRSKQDNWWNATVKYLFWYEDPTKEPTRPTVKQFNSYQCHLYNMRIAQKIEDMQNALICIANWFNKMEELYTKDVMQVYWDRFEHDCASVKKSNPTFEKWQNQAA